MTLSGIAEEVGGGFVPSEDEEEDSGEEESDGYARAQEVLEILEERGRLLGIRYPFRLSGTSIVCVREDAPYLYLLALAVADAKRITLNARESAFERLAASAVAAYFGGGETIHTGARGAESWDARIRRLGGLLAEMPKEPVRLKPTGPGGDEGLDFVFIKPFADGRIARIVVCGNCATGRNNWLSKGKETERDHFFNHFFGRTPQGANLLAIAIPYIPNATELSKKSGRDVIVFDRIRLSEWAPALPSDAADWLRDVRADLGEVALT